MQIPARRISKYVAKTLVGAAANTAIRTTLINHTDLDEDSTTVAVAGGVGGWYVSEKLESRSSALVDMAADKLEQFKNRNDTPKNEYVSNR